MNLESGMGKNKGKSKTYKRPIYSQREEIFQEYFKFLVEKVSSFDEETRKSFYTEANLSQELKEKIENSDLQYVKGIIYLEVISRIYRKCCENSLEKYAKELLVKTGVYLNKIKSSELTPVEKFIDTICTNYDMATRLILEEYGLGAPDEQIVGRKIFTGENSRIPDISTFTHNSNGYLGKGKSDEIIKGARLEIRKQAQIAAEKSLESREYAKPVIDYNVINKLVDLCTDKSDEEREQKVLEKFRILLNGLSNSEMIKLLNNMLMYIEKCEGKVDNTRIKRLIIDIIKLLEKNESNYPDKEQKLIEKLSSLARSFSK